MKTTKMLTVLVLASAIMVWTAEVSEAVPMGTAFTYQGRLIDNNSVADDFYDFQFKLYDANVGGSKAANDVNVADVDVIDGYFTVELDFNDVNSFNGDARWLEIGVRPGELGDSNAYTLLSPRQEITPTPYALHTRWLLVDEALGNVFAGEGAGASNTTGSYNAAVGRDALWSNTTGAWNSAVGWNALYSNTTGWGNSAVGRGALKSNTTGGNNSAVGYLALRSNTTGGNNSAVGNQALQSNTTGGNNSAVGYQALLFNTTGYYNSAVGYQANLYNQGGSRNTIIGYAAGRGTSAHNKSGNVFLGYKAGYNETGSNKLYIANDTGTPLIYGDFSTGRVGIGTTNPGAKLEVVGGVMVSGTVDGVDVSNHAANANAHHTPPTGLPPSGSAGGDLSGSYPNPSVVNDSHSHTDATVSDNISIDNTRLYAPAGAGNVGIGTNSPSEVLDVNGNININSVYKIGGDTVLANTGTDNIFVGEGVGASITTGHDNSAVGYEALSSNTEGHSNLAMGSGALYFNITGFRNSAMGSRALLWNTTGNYNSAVGHEALYLNQGGSYNSAMGAYALSSNTDGNDNSAMGHSALYSNTTGYENSAMGYQAGFNNSTGSGNVFIGYKAGYYETGDNKLYIANDLTDANVLIYGDFSAGNVGIGTTNPLSKLSVGGDGYANIGIYGSGSDIGIYGHCYDVLGHNFGVRAYAGSSGPDNAYGVYSVVSRNGYGNYYSGYFYDSNSGGTYSGLYADVRTGGAIDLAEYILDTQGDTEAGDVLAADPDNDESVIKSSIPYDSAVVGIVSTQPHLLMGMELVMDEETGERYEDVDAAQLSLAGRVPVKVTDENGPIERGDMLTTSSKPGYAMKWSLLDVGQAEDFEELKSMLAENERRRNAVVGKALGNLDSGDGKIVALVNLQ